jgi:putative sigma-54 modulation protein
MKGGSMNIDIVSKNYVPSDKLKEVIMKKAGKLSKYFDENVSAKVLMKKEKDIYKMEITLNGGRSFIRSEVNGENMYDNIDILLPKIEKQIIKNKEKLQKKLKENAFKDKEYLYLQQIPEDIPVKITKFKTFEIYPLSVEDAVDQMNMLDHDFFVFINEKTNKLQIVYRRSDNDIGVLEPIIK